MGDFNQEAVVHSFLQVHRLIAAAPGCSHLLFKPVRQLLQSGVVLCLDCMHLGSLLLLQLFLHGA